MLWINICISALGATKYHTKSTFANGKYLGTNFYMDDIHCIGTEEYALQCPYRGWGKDDCGNSEWAGVTCRKE